MTEQEFIELAEKIAVIQKEYAEGKTGYDAALARVMALNEEPPNALGARG